VHGVFEVPITVTNLGRHTMHGKLLIGNLKGKLLHLAGAEPGSPAASNGLSKPRGTGATVTIPFSVAPGGTHTLDLFVRAPTEAAAGSFTLRVVSL
jgi:hypothetical protein